ncbi:MAG: hypothetical protein JZD41_03745 [Thermoproteus sp.]|nr:hypothetical protein [Thermoproteus sp.]
MKIAYVHGVTQRRIRYTLLYSDGKPLREILRDSEAAAEKIAEMWGGALCRSGRPPDIGVVLIDWMGASLLADLAMCFPLSRPSTYVPDEALDAKFDRMSLCLEPIAPPGEPDEYIKRKISNIKELGKISLRRNISIIKYKGLYFFIKIHAKGDALGGLEVQLGRYKCREFDPLQGLASARRLLTRRGT